MAETAGTQAPLQFDVIAFVESDSIEQLGAICTDMDVEVCATNRLCDQAAEKLMMIYRRVDASFAAPSITENISERIEVLRQCAQLFDVVPVRYRGPITTLDLKTWLSRSLSTIVDALQAIRGCRQYDVRWVIRDNWGTSQQTSTLPVSGKDYLRSRHKACCTLRTIELELKHLLLELSSWLDDLPAHAKSSIRQVSGEQIGLPPEHKFVLAGLELLVPRSQADELLNKLPGLRLGNREPNCVTGPWPAFSFVD